MEFQVNYGKFINPKSNFDLESNAINYLFGNSKEFKCGDTSFYLLNNHPLLEHIIDDLDMYHHTDLVLLSRTFDELTKRNYYQLHCIDIKGCSEKFDNTDCLPITKVRVCGDKEYEIKLKESNDQFHPNLLQLLNTLESSLKQSNKPYHLITNIDHSIWFVLNNGYVYRLSALQFNKLKPTHTKEQVDGNIQSLAWVNKDSLQRIYTPPYIPKTDDPWESCYLFKNIKL